MQFKAFSYELAEGSQDKLNPQTTLYLIDSYNHTGYAQVLEKTMFNQADPDPWA